MSEMKYCTACGGLLALKVPADEDRPRHCCQACGLVHYQNPKMVVGCIPEWKDRILLCLRGIEPQKGLWTLPAGYLENDETLAEGAARETFEEARARVDNLRPYRLFNIRHVNQVYMMFHARLAAKNFAPTPESLEVRLFTENEIPWDALAFPVIEETLKHYFQDRAQGIFLFQVGDIVRRMESIPSA
jgi:ADP-ribose pyrophosphatase YjhB (NUDIX family)